MSRIEIIRRSAEPELFASYATETSFPTWDDDPVYGEFGRSYIPQTLSDIPTDYSFCVVENGQAVALVECNAADGQLSFFGWPLIIRFSSDEKAQSASMTKHVFSELDGIGRSENIQSLHILELDQAGLASHVGRAALARKGEIKPILQAVADLTVPEAELKRDLRSSYKSLINWGKREFSLHYVNKENPDLELFGQYREFHKRIAGRVTRPEKSWDAQFELLAKGIGELSVAYHGEDLVAGMLVFDSKTTTYYSSAVYDRASFEKPLGHWPLYNSMLRSKARGLQKFDLGEIPIHASASEKEIAIGYFKKGFTQRIEYRLNWTISMNNAGCTES